MTVQTLEGVMASGQVGTWLITGVAGEQYFCDDTVFRQTYAAVDADGETALTEVTVEQKIADEYRVMMAQKDRLWALRDELPDLADKAQLETVHDEVMGATRKLEVLLAHLQKAKDGATN